MAEDSNSQDLTSTSPTSPSQQAAIRAFSPIQETSFEQWFNTISASVVANDTVLDTFKVGISASINAQSNELIRLFQLEQTFSPVLPSIKTSPPAPAASPAPPAIPQALTSHRQVLRYKDV